MLKVKGNDSLVRDEYSRAIINTDSNALNKARQAKRLSMERNDKEKQLETRITMLEAKLEELLRLNDNE